ncbi:MAG: hypothetical protein PHV74_10050 [Dehalococcoidia bacterium]|nr:hypothetical protein [Dehalococcoidia bacterium]
MSRIGIAVMVLALAMLLILPAVGVAQPMVCGFYGSASIDGVSVSSGTAVSAWIDGLQVAVVNTTGSNYNMYVAGNYVGKTVSFKVGASQALATQTSLWEAGANKPLTLTGMTAPADPTGITLNPTQGTVTTVSGKGYTPGSTVSFAWGGAALVSVPATVTVGSGGKFEAVIIAPTSTSGTYVIKATDAAGKWSQASFQVVGAVVVPVGPPEIGLSSTQGNMTIVYGSGMTPNSAISFKWNAQPLITYPTNVTAGADGTFSALIVAPTATAGEYVISATDSASKSAQDTFTVVAPAKGDKGDKGDVGPAGEVGAPGAEGEEGSSILSIAAISVAAIALILAIIAIARGAFASKPEQKV